MEINEKYMLKINYGSHRCSLQYHDQKTIMFYLVIISLGTNKNDLSSKIYCSGDFLTIEPGMVHRMEGILIVSI